MKHDVEIRKKVIYLPEEQTEPQQKKRHVK
jgi:hypothetical protein